MQLSHWLHLPFLICCGLGRARRQHDQAADLQLSHWLHLPFLICSGLGRARRQRQQARRLRPRIGLRAVRVDAAKRRGRPTRFLRKAVHRQPQGPRQRGVVIRAVGRAQPGALPRGRPLIKKAPLVPYLRVRLGLHARVHRLPQQRFQVAVHALLGRPCLAAQQLFGGPDRMEPECLRQVGKLLRAHGPRVVRKGPAGFRQLRVAQLVHLHAVAPRIPRADHRVARHALRVLRRVEQKVHVQRAVKEHPALRAARRRRLHKGDARLRHALQPLVMPDKRVRLPHKQDHVVVRAAVGRVRVPRPRAKQHHRANALVLPRKSLEPLINLLVRAHWRASFNACRAARNPSGGPVVSCCSVHSAAANAMSISANVYQVTSGVELRSSSAAL